MRVKFIFIISLIVLIQSCKKIDYKKNKELYLQEQLEFAQSISKFIKQNKYTLHILNQKEFTHKIDSLQSIFTKFLANYKDKLDQKTVYEETILIKISFDRFILEYPELHKRYTGKHSSLSKENQSKLNRNFKILNDTTFYTTRDLKKYITSYIKLEADKKLRNGYFSSLDNQQLHANWSVINKMFTNYTISDYWKHKYLDYHINNFGIKNIAKIYSNFIATCKSTKFIENISKLYNAHKKGREDHVIETYKVIDGFKLDMHLFLPDFKKFKGKRPTIIKFHGGSWSEGKPDWFFSTAKAYTEKGWVVAVVEYRIKGRQNTYPFESVKDAKSAIRWVKEHAKRYNIDDTKIIATGDSAGGHLSLALALVDNWNEGTDNLLINAKPTAIIVNAGVYDLTTRETSWITATYKNKDIAKEISPNHLIKKSKVKMLLIHGDKDRNCPYETARYFYKEMKAIGNTIELHTVKNAKHFIWYGKHAEEVSKITSEYIGKLNY